ncbi:type II toxin-antitoxin system VapC family toxin [Allonocardiopsis opalescens]|uniref:Ribonuclease VapC n=1 Tax=Allonocardiopsis opalescens TaxID=1144618 RepID=A0A2T0PUH5_9ACTN|nr:PIN domain-containing protein [Allonocardiopsis opalescens]PRX92554.1 putative nucleic acid-binding protein [Allonocardiopsis opalescens]
MIVVDASALIELHFGTAQTKSNAVRTLAADTAYCAPNHLHIEVLHALRGLLLGRKIAPEHADHVRKSFTAMAITSVDISGPVADRVWDLRHNLSAYDAAYVAVAEALGYPLVTADLRLATAPGIRCELRLIR